MKKILSLAAAAAVGSLSAEISDLTAEYRAGQVFLQWKETGLSPEARLTVWSSADPITEQNVRSAQKLAGQLNAGSARDWWRDVSSFLVQKNKTLKHEEIFAGNRAESKTAKAKEQGFVLTDHGKPIPSGGGLHVHTPMTEAETGKRYYAVTCVDQGKPAGFTALTKPVTVKLSKPQAIQIAGRRMPRGCGKGRPLLIYLHGRGGGVGVDSKGRAVGTHLFFTDRTLGWREGLPFKFTVSVSSKPDRVSVSFYDRVWIGRNLSKAEYSDSRDQVKAISTFWMGYNTRIGESMAGPEFVCDNYTERLLLKLIDWVQDHFQTDPAAVYISGGSMGGTGAVQLATHFPHRFAAVSANVPIYSYTWKRSQVGGYSSAWRMQCSVGKFSSRNPAKMPDGRDLLDYLNGAKNIARPETDFPAIFACNGRRDQSMPWANNSPFFAAADRAKQFISVYWNDGTHAMTKEVPPDMKKAMNLESLFRFRLDASYPVFSRCSDNKNPGNGDIKDGDIIGWINRGIDWKTLADEPEKYVIGLKIAHPEIRYPVTADVTIRRRQKFRPAPGQTVQVVINGKNAAAVKLDKSGVLTIPGVTFTDRNEVRIELIKK
jgi:dienelactone hydrolase